MDVKPFIREIPDFPKKGIKFKDISPLLASPQAFRYVVHEMVHRLRTVGVDALVAIESRGFVFGAPVALELGVPLVLVRKPGKLPAARITIEYELEYGSGTLEAHHDALPPGARAAIIDDVLATGGTAAATGKLVSKLKGELVAYCFLLELGFLGGREKIGNKAEVFSVINY